MEADFSGYATKANLKCSDGRTITNDAFKHQDQTTVPLVWQHAHSEPTNILGHAVLENRADGVYCHGYFNNTPQGQGAKELVQHKDITMLSIYANQLVEKAKSVLHGNIREVSLVLAGANPGAKIDFVAVQHGDGMVTELDDEAVIWTGLTLEHVNGDDETEDSESEDTESEETVEHADDSKSIKDIFDTFSKEQKDVVFYMMSKALEGPSAQHSEEDKAKGAVLADLTDEQQEVVHFMISEALEHAEANAEANAVVEETSDETEETTAAHADNQEGTTMTNVFESAATEGKVATGTTLSHAEQEEIFATAAKRNQKMSEALEGYAIQHGIDDIETLFPDAKAITSTPEFLKRRTEWVNTVMTETRHTPFSRIKSLSADLTFEEARAKGYIKGNFKKEEFFRVAKRVTTPQTIYKKQQLDRDDILDITDFDVVAWLKGEMRLMLEEEIARAVLVGDGRSTGDEDKIREENVRPIATDSDLYVSRFYISLSDADSSYDEIVDSLVLNRRHYRGSGNPTLFCSTELLARMLLVKDADRRRMYATINDLQAALRVSKIVEVEVMDGSTSDVLAIVVNLQDYTIGADRGGDVALFDDFDIDYNQYKYLIETRISGALTKVKSALVLHRAAANATLVDPVAPTYNGTNHTVTVATTTGIVYRNKANNQAIVTGSPVTLTEGDELTVIATPTTGYYLASNTADEFLYTYEDGRVSGSL